MMNMTMLGELDRIQRMTVNELQVLWRELYGYDSRSRNKEFMVKRLCWRTQEIAYGGLSNAAKARLAELAPAGFQRAQVPRGFVPGPVKPIRDHRLPRPGSVIVRRWRDRDLRLLVRDDGGFELDGNVYGSLTEAARAATGSAWNGRLFWGISKRRRSR